MRHVTAVRVRAATALGRRLPPGAEVTVIAGHPVICPGRAYKELVIARRDIRAAGGDPNREKVCSRCRRVLPLRWAFTAGSGFGQRQAFCRQCRAALDRRRKMARRSKVDRTISESGAPAGRAVQAPNVVSVTNGRAAHIARP